MWYSEIKMALRNRLLRDISELQNKPYPNISFSPYPNDITKACLVLTTDDNYLHLRVDFPGTYPLTPPRITIQTPISHPNVFGDFICASILNTQEGYTPAYDLKGICIQILSFFASDNLEQLHGDATVNLATYKSRHVPAHAYRCSNCDFGRPPVTDCFPPRSESRRDLDDEKGRPKESSSSDKPVRRKQRLLLSDLPDEVLAVVCEHLETEELTPFAQAWDHIGGEKGVVSTFNIIRNREMMCFCLKKSASEAQLGIGVNVRRQGRIGSFESEFDLLSLQAFDEFKIRTSVQGLPFTYWLPLAVNRRHYDSIRDFVVPRLQELATVAALPTQLSAGVLYAFMNDIVVRLCNQAAAGYARSSLVHASEKAIESYYHLFHLLLCRATEDDDLRRSANQTIKGFLVDGKTGKSDVPNLGHLLVAVLISDADVTNDLIIAIIRETITRNVVWMLDSKGSNMQELAYMEANDISFYRLQKTFDASRTSYRLLMFLNLFRKTINRGSGKDKKTLIQLREELFNAHGAPPRGTATRLAGDIKTLQNVKNFPEFFQIMGIPPPQASKFTTFLRDCVVSSMHKGYSVWGITQARALSLRQLKDPEVEVRNGQTPEWNCNNPGFVSTFFPNLPKKKSQGRSNRR